MITLTDKRPAWSTLAFVSPFLLVLIYTILAGPITQNESYHSFADQRTLFGIPNFSNVISNLPFAVVGVLGLCAFRDLASRVLFTGVLLTAFGSSYYHWAPDSARLVWDRLPMTIVFMSLTAMAIGRPKWMLGPLLLFGIASVAWWCLSGDLRLYAIAQFGSILLIISLMLRGRLTGLWPALGLYALAKIAESLDTEIYSTLLLSGHTWKHLLAALSTFYIFRWRRTTSRSAA